jgi:general secretion pathway protein G
MSGLAIRKEFVTMLSRRSVALRRSGFTLLEILIVVAIIVVVAGIGGYYLFGALERGKIDAAKAQIKVIENAVEIYRLAHTVPPQNLQILLQPDAANDGAPYFKEEKAIVDPWGNIYLYEYQDAMGPTIGFKTPNGQVITNKPQQGF